MRRNIQRLATALKPRAAERLDRDARADAPSGSSSIYLVIGAILCAPIAFATPTLGDQSDERLDGLFAELADAPPERAEAVEGRIWEIWADAPSDTADLILSRAEHAFQIGELEVAGQLLDQLVAFAPNFAHGWRARAGLRQRIDDFEGALSDLNRALTLDPRHYDALEMLGYMMLELDNKAAALAAFDEALAINPHLEEVASEAERLRVEVDGRGI